MRSRLSLRCKPGKRPEAADPGNYLRGTRLLGQIGALLTVDLEPPDKSARRALTGDYPHRATCDLVRAVAQAALVGVLARPKLQALEPSPCSLLSRRQYEQRARRKLHHFRIVVVTREPRAHDSWTGQAGIDPEHPLPGAQHRHYSAAFLARGHGELLDDALRHRVREQLTRAAVLSALPVDQLLDMPRPDGAPFKRRRTHAALHRAPLPFEIVDELLAPAGQIRLIAIA